MIFRPPLVLRVNFCRLGWTPRNLFIVHTSRAKVYPLHSLMDTDDGSEASIFINSNVVNMIKPSDHVFDMPERAKRIQKKQSGTINTYNSCSRAPTDTQT